MNILAIWFNSPPTPPWVLLDMSNIDTSRCEGCNFQAIEYSNQRVLSDLW